MSVSAVPSAASWLAPLAVGALLWLVGLPELSWVGFLTAAVSWPTVREAIGHRPGPGADSDQVSGR